MVAGSVLVPAWLLDSVCGLLAARAKPSLRLLEQGEPAMTAQITAATPVPLEACPQSGVLTTSREAGERAACPVCGRWLRIRGDWRWPRHRRPVK